MLSCWSRSSCRLPAVIALSWPAPASTRASRRRAVERDARRRAARAPLGSRRRRTGRGSRRSPPSPRGARRAAAPTGRWGSRGRPRCARPRTPPPGGRRRSRGRRTAAAPRARRGRWPPPARPGSRARPARPRRCGWPRRAEASTTARRCHRRPASSALAGPPSVARPPRHRAAPADAARCWRSTARSHEPDRRRSAGPGRAGRSAPAAAGLPGPCPSSRPPRRPLPWLAGPGSRCYSTYFIDTLSTPIRMPPPGGPACTSDNSCNDETACASYLFGCKTKGTFAVVDPHIDLVDEYVARAQARGLRSSPSWRPTCRPITFPACPRWSSAPERRPTCPPAQGSSSTTSRSPTARP